ncbi:MAG: MBL fold metallo-hydrolase [Planctomycetota bacterium]|jgi:7,8-dihydropterin-6-yl-methyl-4-(beta-D-ribofuranosyl)aminobenzene 5'-phosphate synthase
MQDITITVVYDSSACEEGLETGWGFSCLVRDGEKTILFDTGPNRSLVDNMKSLAIEPESIDIVVLSHIHGDHTGGLGSFLEKNCDVTVYLPKSFPKRLKDKVAGCSAKMVEVERSLEICENVYSTGELGRLIKEQCLVIRTEAGPVLIAGCAHPGIVRILHAARELLDDDILLAIGGFHLEWATKGKIRRVMSALKQSGVRYVGACHCCGDKSRRLLEEHFGEKFIDLGAGSVITSTDLQ